MLTKNAVQISRLRDSIGNYQFNIQYIEKYSKFQQNMRYSSEPPPSYFVMVKMLLVLYKLPIDYRYGQTQLIIFFSSKISCQRTYFCA